MNWTQKTGKADTQTATWNVNYVTAGTLADHATAFDSDFIDLNNPNSKGFYQAAQNFTVNLSIPAGLHTNANGTINSFVSDPGFQFNADPRPPATPATPATLSMMIGVAVGGVQFGAARFRRRRKTVAA